MSLTTSKVGCPSSSWAFCFEMPEMTRQRSRRPKRLSAVSVSFFQQSIN